MKWALTFLLLSVAVALGQEELPLAEPCDEEACQLPDCRCSSTSIPGNLRARDIPQFVLLTFDDAVSVTNIPTYRRLFHGRVNSNQCPAKATFFVSHEYTNYVYVNELYNEGHEIALHSITHQYPITFWRDPGIDRLMQEFGDQRRQMAHFANMPMHEISGMRMPFLQLSGNDTYVAMLRSGLTYDLSWTTTSHISPGLWPYTLDYASIQDCHIPPCPTASIPGAWVLPMVAWVDLGGTSCGMVDTCSNVPALTDEEGWFRFIVGNFERHYKGNRAPFGIYVHEWFISNNPAIERAVVRFMDMVGQLRDAFMVSGKDVIDWVRNPVPLNEYRQQNCRHIQRTFCPETFCGAVINEVTNARRYMTVCAPCPRVHPWLGNYLGR